MKAEVRAARGADGQAVVELADAVASEQVWIGLQGPIDRQAWMQRFTDSLADDAAHCLVAELDEEVVGYLKGNVWKGIADFGMFVAAAARGAGVGAELLEHFIAWAEDRRCHKITLQVWPHNEAAIRLYERYGFAVEGRLRRHWRRQDGALWDSLVMGKVLDTEAPGLPTLS